MVSVKTDSTNHEPDHRLRSVLNAMCARLSGTERRREAELLLCHVTGWQRSAVFAFPERVLAAEQVKVLQALVTQRAQGQPLAYLLGQREFWSLALRVSAATLIPRADTEVLVEQALALDIRAPAARVLDLGTGSGAIALALAHERPHWQLIAVERSAAALAVAQDNGQRLLPGRVDWRLGDWFGPVPETDLDLIVANPPYIDPNDPHLQCGDLRHEPQSALIADEHGLADLRCIIEQARSHLATGGWLLLEHGWNQANDVASLLSNAGYSQCLMVRDYAGQPRVSGGRWRAELSE